MVSVCDGCCISFSFYPVVVWLLLLVVVCILLFRVGFRFVLCFLAYIISIFGFYLGVYMYCTVLADCPMLYALFIKCIAYMYRIR